MSDLRMTYPSLFASVEKTAIISACGMYRYSLTRTWGDEPVDRVLFMMLNPSTADHEQDDNTIKRCISYARRWGYDGLEVVNVFAFRSKDPGALLTASDPVGPENEQHVLKALLQAKRVIAAWGADGAVSWPCAQQLLRAIPKEIKLYCLGQNQDGSPKHPLFVRGDIEPMPFAPR